MIDIKLDLPSREVVKQTRAPHHSRTKEILAMSHIEKEGASEIESQTSGQEVLSYSPEEEKKAVWRLDRVLIPL